MDEKNVYSQILDALTNAYNKFVETFRKHGILICTIIMCLFIIFWTLIINPINVNDIIQKRLQMQYELQQKEQTEYKQQLIDRRYKANDVIGEKMTKILRKYKCSRVMLLEKHNSMQSLGNVDFLYLSASIELIDPMNEEIHYISDDLQRQVVFNLLGADINALLTHNHYLYYDDLQGYKRNECKLLNRLIDEGEKQLILYPFRNDKNRTLLIMVITGENLNVQEITDYIDGMKTEIKDLLIFD